MTVRELVSRLRGAAHIRNYSRDTILFRRGDEPRRLFGVLQGEAVMRRFTAEGVEVVIHRARPDTLFAEAALFSDRYHCDATARAGARIVSFSKPDVLRLLTEDAAFATAFCHRLASQVQGLRSSLELRGIRNAEERIMAALSLRLGDGEMELSLPGTWKQFALDIGMTHEALYRALARLEEAGRLQRDGETVRLVG